MICATCGVEEGHGDCTRCRRMIAQQNRRKRESELPPLPSLGGITICECGREMGTHPLCSYCRAVHERQREKAVRDAGLTVIYWAEAILTGLNTGRIDKNSAIHHKLRQVVKEYRDAIERAKTSLTE